MLGPHGLGQLAAALLCCAAAAGCGSADSGHAPVVGGSAVVERVVDGDTVRLEGLDRVRLIGIDAPELGASPEPCGRAATAFVERLLPPGARVRYAPGAEPRDRYGRLLADVRLPDGRLVARLLAERGFARPLAIEPNTRHASELEAAAARARAAGRGVWGGRCAT